MRAVRKAAGLSQVQMAQAIGRSHQMVAAYERGAPMPPDVLDAVKTVAAKAGAGDLAIELAPGHTFKPARVIEPGETSIATVRARISAAPPQFHDLLDEIFRSGDKDAIDATTSNLI